MTVKVRLGKVKLRCWDLSNAGEEVFGAWFPLFLRVL